VPYLAADAVRTAPDPLPDRLVVILWDGYRHTLENPRIELDSMRSDATTPIALTDIGTMEHETISWSDTLVLVTGVVSAVGVVVMAVVLDGLSSPR